MEENKTDRVTVRLPEGLAEEIKRMAETQGKPISEIIRDALNNEINKDSVEITIRMPKEYFGVFRESIDYFMNGLKIPYEMRINPFDFKKIRR